MKKILVAIPCMDFVDTSFVDSLFHVNWPKNVELNFQFATSSLIYDARNGLARRAIQSKCEYILWLDSDMTFPPDFLQRMLADIEGKEFVSGLYFSRRPPFKPTVYSKCGVEKNEDGSVDIEFTHYKPIPSGIFETEACGFGCVLCKTELFKEIFDRGGLPFSPMLGFGEDLSCCIRFRELGHKLYCDSTILCGHTSHIVIGGDDYRMSWNNALE